MNMSTLPHLFFKDRTASQNGFTLVEVLVAVGLLAIVLASIFGIFTSVSTARNRLDANSSDYHRARVIFERLGRELRSVFYHSRDPQLAFSGEPGEDGYFRLEMTSTASTPLSAQGSGIARIVYRLYRDSDDPKEALTLLRNEQPAHFQAETNLLPRDMMRVSSQIEAMSFRFYANNQWHQQWNARLSGLPRLVEINLQIRSSKEGLVSFRSAFEVPEVTLP